jgi:integrase
VGEVVDELLTLKRENGNTDRSVLSFEHKIRFLPVATPLASLTPQDAEQLYRSEVEKCSVATHHKSLRSAKALFEYCVKKGYVGTNPFKDIRPIGKPNTGKPQLRRDEAKKLSAHLLQLSSTGDLFALALSVQLLFGLRSGEVLKLRKRDIDSDGSMLIVEGTKTKNARRSLQIESPVIRRLLADRSLTLGPDSLLFGQTASGKPPTNSALHKRLRKFCHQAGVPEVCPHSLRGLHSSLAVSGGATSGIVAAALGHGSDAITLKHYIEPSAMDAARSARVSAALLEPELDTLIGALRALSSAQLARVLAAIGNGR